LNPVDLFWSGRVPTVEGDGRPLVCLIRDTPRNGGVRVLESNDSISRFGSYFIKFVLNADADTVYRSYLSSGLYWSNMFHQQAYKHARLFILGHFGNSEHPKHHNNNLLHFFIDWGLLTIVVIHHHFRYDKSVLVI
jgi:hypothetical protein